MDFTYHRQISRVDGEDSRNVDLSRGSSTGGGEMDVIVETGHVMTEE